MVTETPSGDSPARVGAKAAEGAKRDYGEISRVLKGAVTVTSGPEGRYTGAADCDRNSTSARPAEVGP